ncbi:MAG: efflux RND transporter periplasmic adaptor subunit [Xanthobacteraceae bacterium]
MRSDPIRIGTLSAMAAIALAVTGCGEAEQSASGPAVVPAVTVARAVIEDYRPTATFTGRVEAIHKVELRARIDGFLEKRLFDEGSDVKEGALLFVIEKGLYKAAVDEAQAQVAKAEATLQLAEIEVKRQTELVQKAASPQARLDETIARRGEAQGALLAAKANLEKAQLQLGYTDITAPIAGRISRTNVSVGNYVTPSTGTLATIVSQDPIYVSFPVTQRELLELRKEESDNRGDYSVFLQLADGSRYDKAGKVDYLGVTVNQGTDTVQARAVFPNPNRTLIDGALVNVVAEVGKSDKALLVPQQALQADQAGVFVLVVDKDNKVEVRRVEVGESRGARIVVTKGLSEGERVITEGIQRVRPGQVVQPTEIKPVG